MASAASILLNGYKSVEDLYEAIHDVKEDKITLKELQDFWKSGLGVSRSLYKAPARTKEGEMHGKATAMFPKQLATAKAGIQINLSLDDSSVSCYDESKMREWCSRPDIKGESVFGE